MRIKITIVEISFLLMICHYGAAQNHEIKFNLVKGNNGKPLGKINSITQDPHGYMWFSGEHDQCIYRYDGNRMISFRHDSLNKNSVGLTVFEKIYADDSGMIWIGGNGLEKFDPATGIFKHYRHDKRDSVSLVSNEVTSILKDRQGRLWIGTTQGLDRFDEKTEKFIHYRNEPGNTRSLSHNAVNVVYEDHRGVIWVGTGFKWFGYQPGQGGLNRMEADGSFTRYLHDPKNSYSLIDNKVSAIFEDSRGLFWIGTNGDGLNIMDRENGKFIRLPFSPGKTDQLNGLPYVPDLINENITFIHEDKTGGIWFGTRGFGINRFDTGTRKFTKYQSSNGFPDNSGWCAFTSNEGVLWVSTEENNLYRADPFLKKIDNITIGAGRVVTTFLEGNHSDFWVGTDGAGLIHYDQNNKLIQQWTHELTNAIDHPGVAITSLCQFQNDSIWVGTMGGLAIFNTSNKKFSSFRYDNTLKDSSLNPVTAILRDKEGYRWITRFQGLVRFNPKDGTVRQYHPDPKDPGSISTDRLTCAIEDRNGNIWIGGRNGEGENSIHRGGLNLLDKRTDRFTHYLIGLNVFAVYEDSEGTIWAGTIKGLYFLKKGASIFQPFFDVQSEFYDVHIGGGIIEDNHKNLWVTAPSAIIKIDRDRNKAYSYGSKFGIEPNNVSGMLYKTRNGRILVGNQQGFYSFFPGDLEIKSTPFKVNITEFFINNFPVTPGKKSPLTKSVEEINELVLKYNQDNIGFNFAGVDYKAPESNKYFTKLENYDDTWRETGAEKSAHYFYVSPGTYVFRVKAINSDGTVGEKAITIRINPPWWRTWLFRISAILFLVGLLYSLIRWRLQHQFRVKLERSEKEREMAELKQKGTELEMQALRAQMNPHFIFNSLNSINRFILQNNKAQASEYLTKFSKLVRMILQNSQASLITLESELESLELYLNLEALRFDYHFDYKISAPKNLDISALQVPPLILQPYVENAIWHGLMHKEEKGQLDVEVSEEDGHLYFRITDNGIGREKAAELASKSASKHKSMGLRITEHRIAIVQNSQTLTSPVTVNDLVHADGSAAGTEVIIKMPVIYG